LVLFVKDIEMGRLESNRSVMKVLSLLLLSLGPACRGLAVEDVWTSKAYMPAARWAHSSSVVDGIIYVIGGAASEPDAKAIFPVEAYDPATDSWSQKASIPTGRGILSSAVVNGKIYAMGGSGAASVGLSTVEEYDPATDAWTPKAPMPTPRAAIATAAVGGKVYAIGGVLAQTSLVGLATVEEYDPATDTWTRKADMPTPRLGLSASVVDGIIYAIGGSTLSPGGPVVEAYDPATDTWTRRTPMPTARRNHSACVVAGQIYAIGGWEKSSLYAYTTVERYDPRTNTWATETDLPVPRACHSASMVNGRIYVLGGTDRSHPCPALSTTYELAVGGLPLDFDGNGLVDISDLLRLIESWGQDDPAVDIAPPPFGDGIVDAEDLKVLMDSWGKQVQDDSLVAHWKLDEAEGMTASDSAGSHHGTVVGTAAWRPAGGTVGGALEFNGTTSVAADFILNPGNGPFSVLAWVKGGAPGQTLVSQTGGANWLMANAQGALTTELSKGGRSGVGLSSQAVITNGDWHRIAFTWDGVNRRLYVDGMLAAEDVHDKLADSYGKLALGSARNMASGTFWSGLIDDVRIYNRAVKLMSN
jgi:N-acetylneuraminic acid mutarotase